MSLVDEMVELLSGMEETTVAVHPERCVAVRNRHAICLKCVEACTSGALSFEDGELAVTPEKCIGCGTCATACPTSAIEVKSLTDDELTASLKRSMKRTKGHPVIACTTALEAFNAERVQRKLGGKSMVAYDPDAICEVACLGRVDESAIVAAAAYKCFDIALVHGACEGCPHATGRALCERVTESARSILDAFGSEMDVTMSDDVPSRVQLEKPVSASAMTTDSRSSRRDFLKSGKDAAGKALTAVAAEKTATVVGEEAAARYWKVDSTKGTLGQVIPTRRARLYNYLKRLGEPVGDTVRSRVIGSAIIDTEACNSCRMCTVFCPTGALFRVDEEGAWGVAHRSSVCVQCRLCESLCPKKAIRVEETVPAHQFMGKQVVLYDMVKPAWEPNKPDSMYNKFHAVVGEDLNMCMF